MKNILSFRKLVLTILLALTFSFLFTNYCFAKNRIGDLEGRVRALEKIITISGDCLCPCYLNGTNQPPTDVYGGECYSNAGCGPSNGCNNVCGTGVVVGAGTCRL